MLTICKRKSEARQQKSHRPHFPQDLYPPIRLSINPSSDHDTANYATPRRSRPLNPGYGFLPSTPPQEDIPPFALHRLWHRNCSRSQPRTYLLETSSGLYHLTRRTGRGRRRSLRQNSPAPVTTENPPCSPKSPPSAPHSLRTLL